MSPINNIFNRVHRTSPNETVVRTESTTTVRTQPVRRFNIGTTLRNTAIGGAVGSALGGVALLTKFSIPLLGKVSSLAGVAKFGAAGAGIGVATAVLPVVAPSINRHPMLKAALTGAGIGASAGMFLPLLSPVFGAIAGAAIGAGVHLLKGRNDNDWRYNVGRSTGHACSGPGCGQCGAAGMPPTPFGPPPFGAAGPWDGGYRKPGLLSRLLGGNGQWRPISNVYTGQSYVGYGAGHAGMLGYGGMYGPSMMGGLGSNLTSPLVPNGMPRPQIQQPLGYAGVPGASPQMAGAPAATGPVTAGPAAAVRPRKPKKAKAPAKSRKPKKHAARRPARAARPVRPVRVPAGLGPVGQAQGLGLPQGLGMPQGVGLGMGMPQGTGLTNPSAFLGQGLGQALPFSGGSPFSAGRAFEAQAPALMGSSMLGMPGPGAIPTLTAAPAGLPAGAPSIPGLGVAPGLPGLDSAMPDIPGL